MNRNLPFFQYGCAGNVVVFANGNLYRISKMTMLDVGGMLDLIPFSITYHDPLIEIFDFEFVCDSNPTHNIVKVLDDIGNVLWKREDYYVTR